MWAHVDFHIHVIVVPDANEMIYNLVWQFGRLTLTSAFVWMQLEAISTCTMIGAMCINATMFAAAIAWLTFIDIWKDQITHDKINLIGNQPLTSWILLQNTKIHLNFLQWKSRYLTQTSLNFPPIYQYLSTGSGHCLVPPRRQVVIWTNEVLVYSLICLWWVKISVCTDLTIWYGTR